MIVFVAVCIFAVAVCIAISWTEYVRRLEIEYAYMAILDKIEVKSEEGKNYEQE